MINRGSALLLFLTLAAVRLVSGAVEMGSWLSHEVPNDSVLDVYGENFTSISVYAYNFDTSDNIRPAMAWVDSTLVDLMENKFPGRPVFLTIANNVAGTPPQQHDGALTFRVLSDPVKRAQHISQIVALSAQADGVEIDYQSMLTGTREFFSQFIAELRASLPPGKLISVMSQPKTDDVDGPDGQAIDWPTVAVQVDMFKVMAYYFSSGETPPGPPSPLDSIAQVINFARAQIPPDKLHMVATQYGWDWPEGATGTLISYTEAIQIAADRGATPFRDPASQSLRVIYTDDGDVSHQIWFSDQTTFMSQVELIQSLGVDKIDAWHMGVGDPQVWTWVAGNTVNPKKQNPTPSLEAINPSVAISGSPALTITVQGTKFMSESVVQWNGSNRPTTFVGRRTVTVTLPASDLVSAGVSNITVFNPSPGGGTSAVFHFTVAASSLGGAPPLSDLNQARAYPNPWSANRHSGAPITFDRLTQDASIKIFTVAAEWVKSLPADTGDARWDLTNDSGETVASGYYIYLITDPSGNKKQGKVAIIK